MAKTSNPLCIYHGNCADGFAAAWVVRGAFARTGIEVDFFPGVYGEPPPDVTDRDVYIVDFSYKRPVLEEMAARANTITILDHHKTAEADLAAFGAGSSKIKTVFDMTRSGARITWDFFYGWEVGPPPLLLHIEDRDLWLFKLEGTREIQANVFSYPYDFEVWDKLMASDPQILRAEGAAIERKHHKDIAELVGVSKRRMIIGGHDVPVANLPYTLSSDAGHKMAKGEPFAACYMDTPTGRVFSLRSTPDGVDVSEIARAYGGGGHAKAAGFTVPIGWEGDNLPPPVTPPSRGEGQAHG